LPLTAGLAWAAPAVAVPAAPALAPPAPTPATTAAPSTPAPGDLDLARQQAAVAASVIQLSGRQQRRGRWQQALALVEAALANADQAEPKWRARLAAARGGLLIVQARRKDGGWDRAITELEGAIAQGRAAGDAEALGTALDKLGLALHHRTLFTGKGDYLRAQQVLDEALQVRTAAPAQRKGVSETLFHQGLCAEHGGQRDRAGELYRRSLAIAERARDQEGISRAHRHLGSLQEEVEAWPAALQHYRRALAATRQAGDRMGLAPALSAVADAMIAAGQPAEEPRRLLEEALAQATALQDLAYVAHTRLSLGRLAQTAAEREAAATHLREALRAAETVQDRGTAADARKRLAALGLSP
jgi:tetratricopeptide (TPR) repeat protein